MKKGLGRGLADLKADLESVESVNIPILSEKDRVVVKSLKISDILPNPDQPRKNFKEEELKELSDSIKEKGVLQAILVRQVDRKDYKYEIIAGERRWRASKMAGLEEIPAIVKDVNDENAMEIAIIENIQREDLNPLEEAIAYQNLIDTSKYTLEDLNRILGKSISYLRNSLRLIKLPDSVKEKLKNNELTAGHARALVVLGDKDAESVSNEIIKKNLSVRDTENLIKTKPRESERKAKTTGIDINEKKKIEQKIKLATGVKAQISVNVSGKGTLKLVFNNLNEMNRLIEILTEE